MDESGMKPEMGDMTVTLPITFDYSGGRKEKSKSSKLWAIILIIIGIVVVIGILAGKSSLLAKLLLVALIIVGVMFFVRFVLLKEGKKRKAYDEMVANDFEFEYRNIWGIYNISEEHPYICRFRNGKSGMYIRLNKDVILGKYIEAEYNHYQAIADAYNLAGAGKVQMVHVDYMDNVGTDERLDESIKQLNDVSNIALRNCLTKIYSFQKNNLMRRVTTFDVYVFLWTGNDYTAWNTISRILGCFLDANYRSYTILDQEDIRELTKTIFNIQEFSITTASASAFNNVGKANITPISLQDVDGSIIKYNKTSEEIREENRLRDEQLQAKKKVSKEKKVKTKETQDDEFFDI